MARPLFVSFAAAAALAGCAHGPAVSTSDNLPLKRVVIYRNGVAYFERDGRVDEDEVAFQVQPEQVSDFLATLSVMERGGSSVQSASFPLSTEEAAPPAERDPDGEPQPAPSKPGPQRVVLKLDGKEHDLRVGYVAEQPVWRPSYRLVFDGEQASLQSWGIVQNVSGEDWTGVQLSLVAGAPIAFRSTLATPVVPERPVVSDQGELISAVPRSENQLEQGAEPPPPPPPPPPAASRAMDMPITQASPKAAAPREKAKKSRSALKDRADDLRAREADDEAEYMPSAPRNLALLASQQVVAGATRYDVPNPVTVPDHSATMVLLVSREVPGERVFLFAPDPGVPDSSQHPFRVARFKNDTPGLLERGPIAFFARGAFLGQGVLEPLAAGAEATVPFALERALAVDVDRKSDAQSARIRRVEAGQLTVERDQTLKTTYRVRNGGDEAARVLIKHPRTQGMRLVEPPKGTDDRVGEGNALVPVQVAVHATAQVTVDERRPYPMAVDWMSPYAEEAVKAFLADPKADPKAVEPLRAAWALREELRKANEEHDHLSQQRAVIENAASQTRASLQSISRAKTGVADLRKTLSSRLGTLEKQNADLTQQLLKLELRQNELQVRFGEAVRQLHLEVPAVGAAQAMRVSPRVPEIDPG